MDPILTFLTQPWVVILLAIGVYVGRVVYLAKRLKAAARHPTLADLRALEEAKKALDEHHKSLDTAKATLTGNLGGARDTLRHYKRPFTNSVDGRREGLASAMKGLGDFHEPLEKARAASKASLKKDLKAAKELYKSTVPRSARNAPKDI